MLERKMTFLQYFGHVSLNDAIIQTDLPQNLITLTMEQLMDIKSKRKRDAFYKRRKRTPISSDITQNIYINEDLTLHRARLYHDTRKLVKSGKLCYTWTQHGNIMIRVTEDSPPTAVHSNEELQSKLRLYDNESLDRSLDYETPIEETDISSDED